MEAQQARKNGLAWGRKDTITTLTLDIYRTYGIKGLPTHDPQAFERALQFRENEKRHYSEIQARYEQMTDLLNKRNADLGRAHAMIDHLNEQFSSLKQTHERSDNSRDRASSSDGVQDIPVSKAAAPEQQQGSDRQEPTSTGGGARGHTDEHGGPAGNTDGEQSELVIDQPNPEASE